MPINSTIYVKWTNYLEDKDIAVLLLIEISVLKLECRVIKEEIYNNSLKQRTID